MMVVKIKSKGNKSACHKKDKINNLEKKIDADIHE